MENETNSQTQPAAPENNGTQEPVSPIVGQDAQNGVNTDAPASDSTKVPAEGDKPVEPILDAPKDGEKKDDPSDKDKTPKEGDKPAETVEAAKYEYKLPEGFELKGELRGEIDKFVSEGKLSQEVAQKGIELFMKAQQENAQAYVRANETFYRNETEALQKDAEYGGQNYQQTRELIRNGYKAFLNLIPESRKDLRDGLDQMMVKSRMANLLPFSIALRNLGAALKEGGSINPGNTGVSKQPVQFKTGKDFSIAEAVAANFPAKGE